MTRPFILIASYPKSGNTWTRIVFERLLRGADVPLNAIDKGFFDAARRRIFDRYSPVDASDLTQAELIGFHGDVYRSFAAVAAANTFIKVHEPARSDDWFYPPECVRAVVYLVRHPFDVAVSSAHHFGQSIDSIVDFMNDERDKDVPLDWLPGATPLPYGSWSANVSSWLDANAYTLAWARYEDLRADPQTHFMRLARATGIETTQDALARVIEASRFETLKKEEEAQGFRERPKSSPQFFRAGRAGTWKDVLGAPLRDKLIRDHGAVMERIGYTADGGTVPLGD